MSDTKRERFEKWATSEGFSVERSSAQAEYWLTPTEDAWEVWHAASAEANQRIEALEKKLLEWKSLGADSPNGMRVVLEASLEGHRSTVKLLEAAEKKLAERDTYEALYAEAREILCSCNIVDQSKPVGDPYNYVCEWCESHPQGAEAPPIIKKLWRLETKFAEREAEWQASQKNIQGFLDDIRVAVGKLDSQIAFNPSLPEVYTTISANAWYAIRKIEHELRSGSQPLPEETK